jgi:hypothetical protein
MKIAHAPASKIAAALTRRATATPVLTRSRADGQPDDRRAGIPAFRPAAPGQRPGLRKNSF